MNEYWQQEFSKCTSAFHPDFDMEDIICLLTALLKQLLTDNSGVEDAMSKMKKVDVEMEKKVKMTIGKWNADWDVNSGVDDAYDGSFL